jgi:uncharacterized Zn finger protein (UPF0148 family)
MEKCPKCKHWTLIFDLTDGTIVCVHCQYQKHVDSAIYFEKFDAMTKLSKSFELNGYNVIQ